MESNVDMSVSQWKGQHWFVAGPSWAGFKKIKHLIVFGASYCQTCIGPQSPPTEEEPLGVPFPGHTYTEGPPNWVGYLAKSCHPALLVHNYAQGGQTVAGVRTQVTRQFMERHPPVMPWTASDTIFATWIGINDLAYTNDVQPSIKSLFEVQHEIYNKGARNFLFIDVPPVERTPVYRIMPSTGSHIKFNNWNVALERAIRSFVADKATSSDPVTVVYFSSHKVFTTILEDPQANGFPQDDLKKEGGSIWMDHLHPTSAVHLIVANQLNALLSGIPPFDPSPAKHGDP